jgi:hypothetical protein
MIQLTSLIIITVLFILAACGEDSYEEVVVEKPAPEKPETPGGEDPTEPGTPTEPAEDARTLALAAVAVNCTTCHNGVIQAPSLKDERAIDANRSRICIRVGNGSMPPAGMPNSEREKILEGLEC